MRVLLSGLVVLSLLGCTGLFGDDEAEQPVVDPAAEPSPEPGAEAQAEPPKPPPLKGWAKVGGVSVTKTVRIHNEESRDWTNCTVKIDKTYSRKFERIKRLATDATPYGKFKDGEGEGMPKSHSPAGIGVSCHEGYGYFKPSY